VSRQRIDQFRRQMYQVAGSQPIRTRHDARLAVATTAAHAREQLGVSEAAFVLEYIAGAMGGLDNYSDYLSADQLKDVYSQIEGNFIGLGVELKADNGALLIVHVIPGSPAQQAGIKADDRIVAVDSHATREMSTDAAAALLQGEEGSSVMLTMVTPGQSPRQISVRRQNVEVPSVEGVKIIDADYRIGYIRLPSFQKTTSRDLDVALWSLHRQGMQSLILDLRDNPGGLLTASVEVADKFIKHGRIVSTRGRNVNEDFNYVAHEQGTWAVPLVVLINGDSASASEIFAGAISDHGRGKVVGTRSYGKGSVQGIFPLSITGAGVRLTTARFYSPHGRAISKVGIKPDIDPHLTARVPVGENASVRNASASNQDIILEAGLRAARRPLASR
jgi:carboxyl-terminal processing protease